MRKILLFLAVAAAISGCSRREDAQVVKDDYVFAPIVAASAHIAVVEKPDAARALLVGEGAKALEPYLKRSGVKCFKLPEGKFDMIVVACSEMSEKSCGRLTRYLSENRKRRLKSTERLRSCISACQPVKVNLRNKSAEYPFHRVCRQPKQDRRCE